MAQKTILLIGAGQRGVAYTNYATDHPDEFKVVGVADPNPVRKGFIKEKHEVPEENCYDCWQDALKREKFADLAMICTQDRDHIKSTLAAIEAGYDILLEKPMAVTPEDCLTIQKAAEAKGVKIVVCFVLRYTPFYMAMKKLILDGKVGRVMNIDHIEAVGNVHQSHSFTRGNWRNSDESSCMILQKSSHDMDILAWLIDSKCEKIQSFGSLSYFTHENRPKGAPDRCIDGCPHADTCFYNSVYWYLENKENAWFRSVAANTSENPSDELVEKALRETDYGKCVFNCPNNVVDHQSANLLFENGVIATFTMSAFNEGGRYTKVMGTKGELTGNMNEDFITYYDFATRETTKICYSDMITASNITGGHGGGDTGMMKELYEFLDGSYTGFSIAPISDSATNHIMAFAAEYSRVNGGMTVSIEDYKKAINK